jgi:hypothetical protein
MAESTKRLLILMTTLTIILWINANSFDVTEVKSITMFFISMASIEGGTAYLKSTFGKKE